VIFIKKGQTWSYDILTAVAVLVIAFIGFYGLASVASSESKAELLSEEGTAITSAATAREESTNISFVIDNAISPLRLKKFSNQDYDDIRNQLGINTDFCLHFEDGDGNHVEIIHEDNQGNLEKIGIIGSPELNLKIGNEITPCS
jgi:hypothetical protein